MNAPYDGLFFKDPYIKHVLGDVLSKPGPLFCRNASTLRGIGLPEDQV